MDLRFLTAGESHGAALTAILEGIPAGLAVNLAEINKELRRRQMGYGRGGRMKIEQDEVKILSGVRFGETIGSPITLEVVNRDHKNWGEKMAAFGEPKGEIITNPRPGHADLPGSQKYGRRDLRDILERSSARETTMRVAVGAICRQFLAKIGVEISSRLINLGGVQADKSSWDIPPESELNCADPAAEAKMKERIDDAKAHGDTLGGTFEVKVTGLMPGLGSHIQWDRRLDARLAAAVMSVQAIKGVEIGLGNEAANLPGSEVHDEILLDDTGRIYRATNRAGGLEGGMTNGEEIILRATMKPIPTLMRPLATVDLVTKQKTSAAKERSDTSAVAAASVVGEAMTAIVVAEAVREKFGGDAMSDVLAAIAHYKARL